MNFHDLRIIVSQIKKNITCPKCKLGYTDEDIEVIGSLGDEHNFFHASCAECESESVVHVNLHFDEDGMILPDLRRLGSAPRMGNVSANEVLDMRNYLKDFEGDFGQLFKNSKKTS
jgi:hypothetical protein